MLSGNNVNYMLYMLFKGRVNRQHKTLIKHCKINWQYNCLPYWLIIKEKHHFCNGNGRSTAHSEHVFRSHNALRMRAALPGTSLLSLPVSLRWLQQGRQLSKVIVFSDKHCHKTKKLEINEIPQLSETDKFCATSFEH